MKKIIIGFVLLLSLSIIPIHGYSSNIDDLADIFSVSQESLLQEVIERYQDEYELNVEIISLDNEVDVSGYIQDYYSIRHSNENGIVIAFNKFDNDNISGTYQLFGDISNYQDILVLDDSNNKSYVVQDICYQLKEHLDSISSNHVKDMANLLTNQEITSLDKLANSINNYDVNIVTINSVGNSNIQDFSDDYYDYHISNKDGLVLVLDMSSRDWYISTSGKAINAFSDWGIEHIGNDILSDLKDGNYYDAFKIYLNDASKFIEQYNTGKAYDSNNQGDLKETTPTFTLVIISLVTGLVIGLINGFIKLNQLKTKKSSTSANDYIDRNSLELTTQRDLYLFTTTSRTAKPKNDSSSGSSTHTSSSGNSHGGGGGKF